MDVASEELFSLVVKTRIRFSVCVIQSVRRVSLELVLFATKIAQKDIQTSSHSATSQRDTEEELDP